MTAVKSANMVEYKVRGITVYLTPKQDNILKKGHYPGMSGWRLRDLTDVMLNLLLSPGIAGNQTLLGEILTDIYGEGLDYDPTNWNRREKKGAKYKGWFFPDKLIVQRRIKELKEHYKDQDPNQWIRDLKEMSQAGKPATVKEDYEDTLEQEEIEEAQLDSV